LPKLKARMNAGHRWAPIKPTDSKELTEMDVCYCGLRMRAERRRGNKETKKVRRIVKRRKETCERDAEECKAMKLAGAAVCA